MLLYSQLYAQHLALRMGFSNQVSYDTSWKVTVVFSIDMFNKAKQDGYQRGRCSAPEGLVVLILFYSIYGKRLKSKKNNDNIKIILKHS